ncbi:hypothetical protein HMPREF9473_03790 [ [Hungatella hathewayi WAL-18680]|uniref:Uncharacterized protein n=1 Tax=Hungatella hathewayi WAL-18680 TaxID=742737 RepID=G5IJW2_9FIRM|nr:hypothetical protein HMPREF9473_03790 [ [Hungatella hathewayi WAL-18680]
MSLIGKEISDFTVQAYTNGEFKPVSKNDILGKWSVFSSIRPTLHLYVPRS